jgi:hypothetical protein
VVEPGILANEELCKEFLARWVEKPFVWAANEELSEILAGELPLKEMGDFLVVAFKSDVHRKLVLWRSNLTSTVS